MKESHKNQLKMVLSQIPFVGGYFNDDLYLREIRRIADALEVISKKI